MENTIEGGQRAVEMIPFGDAAVLVEFGRCIHPDIHRKVKAFVEYLDSHSFPGMIEYIPAFSSVTVFYDPVKVKTQIGGNAGIEQLSCEIVISRLKEYVANIDTTVEHSPRVVEIPVCYGGEFGPDLEFVAEHNKLSAEEVVRIHTNNSYLVYMIGFAPGFPYLGGMSEQIAAPRRQTPRMAIPAGTVGIAGMQTGVYPIVTPGGWQLIGRTPMALFRPNDDSPSLLRSGDIIRFYPVSHKEYEELRGRN